MVERERESLLPKKTPAKQRGATKLVVALISAASLALVAVAVVPRTSKGDHQCAKNNWIGASTSC